MRRGLLRDGKIVQVRSADVANPRTETLEGDDCCSQEHARFLCYVSSGHREGAYSVG